MSPQIQNPAGAPGFEEKPHHTGDHANTEPVVRKYLRTLREIYSRSESEIPEEWLHRKLAERIAFDHCLPTTICDLEKKGIAFERKEITLRGYGGRPARYMAYKVAPDSMALAREMLGVPG